MLLYGENICSIDIGNLFYGLSDIFNMLDVERTSAALVFSRRDTNIAREKSEILHSMLNLKLFIKIILIT